MYGIPPLENVFQTAHRRRQMETARAGVNVDGCRRFESGVKKRYESCFRPLHLFLVTEKKKKICVEGVKKNRPQTEKTAAFKAAGSDQFHIGPCTSERTRSSNALGGFSNGKRTTHYSETEESRIKPHILRALPKHTCVLVHAERGFRQRVLPPIEPDGRVCSWCRNGW